MYCTYIHTGGWGLVNIPSTSEHETQWNINGTQFLQEKKIDSPSFFNLYVGIDDKDSSRYVLTVSQLSHCLHKSTYNQNVYSCFIKFLDIIVLPYT